MIIVKVIYTAAAAFTSQNQENIRAVMTDLLQLNNPGINYHVCLGPDGQTFTHTAFFQSEEERKVLNELPSFLHFQQELKASGPEVPPRQELLSLVGSSKDIFNA